MEVAEVLNLVRRRWLALLVCVVAGLVGAIGFSRAREDRYEAASVLFVSIPATTDVQEALQGVQLSSYLLQSYARIATSTLAAEEIVERLDLEESPGSVSGRLRATVQDQTLLITLVASDPSPVRAQQLADAAAEVFIELVREVESGRPDQTTARVIDAATVPTSPVGPSSRQNILVGVAFGFVAGAGLMLLIESLDRSIRTPDGAREAASVAVLGVIPRRRNMATVDPASSHDVTAAEAFRTLRTSLRFAAIEGPIRSVLVSSPSASEGKSTIAANLALAMAASGERIIVLDADLRRPRQAQLFGVEGRLGLTALLSRQATLDEVLEESESGILVVASGVVPTNPAEMVGSQAMADVVSQLENRADVVIIDAPPILLVTDAVALSTQVDRVVMVVRAGRTTRPRVEEAVRRLSGVGADVLGVVLNAAARSSAETYGGYRYEST